MPDHLGLIKENVNLVRQGKRTYPFRERKVNVNQHGNNLKNNFNTLEKTYKEESKIAEDFILTIHKDSPMDINVEKIGLKVLAELDSKDRIIAQVVDRTIFNNSISDFTANKINKTKTMYYSEFANINEFNFLTPEEKMTKRLSNNITDLKSIIIDVQLHTLDRPLKDILENVTHFKQYIKAFDGKLIADCILEHLVILRIDIKTESLLEFLEHKNIFIADLPQQPIYEEGNYKNISFENLPKIINPEEDAPKITVLDSGVIPTHPLLSGSIASSESFGDFNSPFDEEGHGTMVSGIIQYGDVYETILSSKKSNLIKQNFHILNARVTDKNNLFPVNTIISKTVAEAIDYYADPNNGFNSKIFNLSIGDPDSPYIQDTKMDPWSYQLDVLNHKYNIAVVVSAGNYHTGVKPDNFIKNYIHHMLEDDDANVIPPALGISTITVGSFAKDDSPSNNVSKTIPISVAAKDNPSPFTRLGPGYKKSIKPDTIAYGGNYTFEPTIKRFNKSDRSLGILSTSIFNQSNNSWFEVRNGTSFAAPYISHLLGLIQSKFSNAKGNLLRALLLSNSKNTRNTDVLIKNNTEKNLTDGELKEKVQRIEGYGNIHTKNLINSSDNCVKMFYEGEVGIDKATIFEVPIPSEIYNSKKSAYITISIAYNPPCRDKRIDYKGTSLDFELLRGVSREKAIRYLCNPDKNNEFEKLKRIKDKFRCNMTPSITTASRGTTIVSKHKITNSRDSSESEYNNQYYLGIRCYRKWYSGEKPQEFAVVVTVETEDEKIDIYTPIKNRVEMRSQARARI